MDGLPAHARASQRVGTSQSNGSYTSLKGQVSDMSGAEENPKTFLDLQADDLQEKERVSDQLP
jgi:hypothetical protein